MHISEGVLNTTTLIAGWAVSAPLYLMALYKVKQEELPKVALLSAMFFVGSFVHIPLGPTSFHLLLSGVIAGIGGFYAFLSIGIALLFQALLFGFGGLLVLGINIFIIATPAVIVWHFLRPKILSLKNWQLFLGGALPTFLSFLLLSAILLLNHQGLQYGVGGLFLYNIPLMILEGLICVAFIQFLRHYAPKFLE